MYKKSITFEDFEGNTITKDYYFNLTKAEVLEMQLSAEGGLDKRMQRIVGSNDQGKIITTIKDIILKSYGKRTDEGFVKSPEIAAAFSTTEAYSNLFMELVQDEKEQQAFFVGIMPKEVSASIKDEFAKNSVNTPKISVVE